MRCSSGIIGYLRKIKAMELKPGDPVPAGEGMNLITDRIRSCDPVPSPEDRVFCLTVADDHTVLANGIYTGQCDGDEDCIMLLLDGLINFSRSFLPETRGGSMDAPLVLTSRIDPAEIDKESLNIDVGAGYPLELYLAAASYTHPKDVEHLVDRVERRLGNPAQLEGFFFTHPTSNISAGPLESTYTKLETMLEKLEAELEARRRDQGGRPGRCGRTGVKHPFHQGPDGEPHGIFATEIQVHEMQYELPADASLREVQPVQW